MEGYAVASEAQADALGEQIRAERRRQRGERSRSPVRLPDSGSPSPPPEADGAESPTPPEDEDDVAALESELHELRVASSPGENFKPNYYDDDDGDDGELVRGQQVVIELPPTLPPAHLLLGVAAVRMSTCLFPRGSTIASGTPAALTAMESALEECAGPQLVLLLRSGRFAGAVYEAGGRLAKHRTITKYTTRRGQGGSQSAMDGSGKKPKSAGASLRRAGEVALREEVAATLLQWQPLIDRCSLLLLVCPKTMRDHLFGAAGARGALGVEMADPRVRFVPFPTQRPTLDEAKRTREKCMALELLVRLEPTEPTEEEAAAAAEAYAAAEANLKPPAPNPNPDPNLSGPPLLPISALGAALRRSLMDGNLETLTNLIADPNQQQQPPMADPVEGEAAPEADAAAPEAPQASLREALVERDEAGRTPLHLAANPAAVGDASDDADAEFSSEAVTALLSAGADPGARDWRGRSPYQAATAKAVRDAFRRYRGAHEGDWDWDAAAVPEGLTAAAESEAAARRKAKAKEKRKRQKARRKELAQIERDSHDAAKVAETERLKREAEEEELRKAGAPKCDGCEKPFKPDDVPFFRLDYQYCSTKCIAAHKRQLMAEAAAKRFGR